MSQETLLGPYLKPGTPIKVGNFSTKIVRYLSEGGFSHVYIARLDIPVKGSEIAVLKRIVAPDKAALAAIRTEVETMKKLKGHRHIVTYYDSHASALKTGGYEVYVLMEYCPGGGLIDFMNTRLQTRLAEWEVLKIISDTTQAVACMHYLRPPLLHRDLKIENVLISNEGCYKLCDFGSCTEPKPPATNSTERRALEEDIQKNTTIQYRSPEMVDVSRRLPIDEKCDIWALGVLLYKLCYFTTPFESQGQLAILNAAYTFPAYPPYTDRTKRLIAVTLQENPRDRPNIYQLLAEICAMRNVPIPIPDIYTKSRSGSAAGHHSRPSSRPPASQTDDVLAYEPVEAPNTQIVDHNIVPMRRGRPDKREPDKIDYTEDFVPQQDLTRQVSNASIENGAEADFSTKYPSLEEIDLNAGGIPAKPTQNVVDNIPRSKPLPVKGDTRKGVEAGAGVLSEPGSLNPRVSNQARPLPSTPQISAITESSSMEERTLKPSEVGRSGDFLRKANSAKDLISQPQSVPRGGSPWDSRELDLSGPPVSSRSVESHVEKIDSDEARADGPASFPDDSSMGAPTRSTPRPAMISRSSQTSPKVKQGVQTQTSPMKKEPSERQSNYGLSSNLMRDSSGYIVSRPSRLEQPVATQYKPQFKFTTSLDRAIEGTRTSIQVDRPKSSTGTRPMSIHVDSDMRYLEVARRSEPDTRKNSSEELDVTNRRDIQQGRSLAGSLEPPRSAQAVHGSKTDVKRSFSVSSSSHKHGHRPSLSHIPSFSGTAKNIMSGKFGDAFKKFEVSGKSKASTPAVERSNPLQVAEDDLPDHVTHHLQNTEARRSSSYSRSNPASEPSFRMSEDISSRPVDSEVVESTSTSVKEAMRKLKEKANQTYVPHRSAQGYGKYTNPEIISRAATVIPYSRPPLHENHIENQKPSQSLGKNTRRYGLSDKFTDEDDESSAFSKRYPSLSDFKV